MDETISLWTLFASSFLAATVLPGGSEIVLYGVLKWNPDIVVRALAVATVGNTLGGLSSYLLGRLIPRGRRMQPFDGVASIQRYGARVLLLSWVPLVGDALCVAAGWFRLNPWVALFYIAVGKFARYLAIAVIV